MTGLPPVDARSDGVLTSLFDDGILLFNRTAAHVTVNLSMPDGDWGVNDPGLSASLTLSASKIRRLARH